MELFSFLKWSCTAGSSRRFGGLVFLVSLVLMISCAPGRVPRREVKPEDVVTHRVIPGETWESLSRDYYGTEKRADETLKPGTGVRVPLNRTDLRYLRKKARAVGVYNEGLELVSRKMYGKAVEKFREALKLDPSLRDAEFNIAVCWQKLGLHEKAVGILESLVKRSGPEERYLFALGNSRFHLKEFGKAADTFKKVLALNPSNLKALFSLAVTFEKMGRKDDAVETWRRYLKLDKSGEWADSARRHLESLTKGGGGSN